MKIAISGKGGVGKTTVAAMLAGALGLRGRPVVALDADPDANLAAALGVPPEEEIVPLAEMRDLIAERTGSTGKYGAYFRLNPKVDDIPDRYARRIGPIRLMVLGGVAQGGAGCICPATALLKALLVHLILGRDEALIMDMEAGIEHLGRATAQSMQALLVVVTEGAWSIQTAHRVRRLAGDLGMQRVFAVANAVAGTTDLKAIAAALGEVPLIGQIPYDARFGEGVLRLDGAGRLAAAPALADHLDAADALLAELERRLGVCK